MAKAGRISIDISAGTAQFVVDMEQANRKLNEFARSAGTAGEGHRKLVTDVQATSGALRTLEGGVTNNIRAAERWLASIKGVGPALQAIYPAVGLIAVSGVLVRGGEELSRWIEKFKQLQQASERVAGEFQKLNQPIAITNDELRVANDRLQNEIAKIQGNPQNGLKLALDEARLAADRLSESLGKDLEQLYKLTKQETVGFLAQLQGKAGTGDISKELGGETGFGGFQGRVAGAGGNASQLTGLYKEEIAKFQSWLDTAKGLQKEHDDWKPTPVTDALGVPNYSTTAPRREDQTARIEELQGAINNLKLEMDHVSLTSTNTALQRTHDVLSANASNSKPFEDWQKKIDEAESKMEDLLSRSVTGAYKKQNTAMDRIGLESREGKDPYTEYTQKRDEKLSELYREIAATNELAAAQSKGADAVRQAQEAMSASKSDDPAVQAAQAALNEAKHAETVAATVAQLNRESEAIRRLTEVTDGSLFAKRAAELDNLQNSGGDPEVIKARAALLNVQFGQQDAQNLTGSNSNASAGFTKFFKELQSNTKTAAQDVHDILGGAFQSLNGQLERLVTGQKVSWAGFFESLASSFASAGLNKLEGLLGGLLGGGDDPLAAAFGGGVTGSGSGGFLSKLFGGFRAGGGDVAGGTPYVVGEQGPELWVPPGNGSIVSNGALSALGNQHSGASYYIDARGSDEAAIDRRVRAALVQVHGSSVRSSVAVQNDLAKRKPQG